ncbi:uncharacterized protein LOC102680971 isoform X2 [Apis dorsata]|uniref:uncharacterized protein LOC102680971 isoform X2 n=1 Tax=Apis dorsata TaxID=7462 RepID=UPI0003DF58D2|nr:uncharacterized protein LOC102680971 isoform X2 [Apis dorsata]
MHDSNRKGKLARCWLAATFSEKMFKKTCKPALIKKINVSYICNEILSTVEIQNNNKSYGRFSLYLSSQLMYGATKILFYQTKYFQDYLFEVNWKLHEINRYKEELNAVMSLELPEIPPISEVFRNLEMSSNLHLITEEPYSSAIENLIQNEMNFGALPTHEMEKFILPGVEELSLNEIRRFHWDQSIEIPNESIQVPLLDVNKFEIEIEKETRLASAGRDQPESFFIFENHHIKNIPATPKKRTSKSPIEIPIKRRKITSTEELPAIELFPAPITEIMYAPDLSSELQKEVFPQFQNIELNEIKKTKKKKIYLDKQTKLTDTIMRRYIENVYAHTIKQFRFTTILPSAKEYLKQPSMKINNRSWGKTLIEFFNQYFKKPLIIQSKFQDMLDFKMKETIVGETIRADDSSRLRDQITELSSKIMIATTETIDVSKTLDKILPIESIEVKEFEEQTKEIKESEAVLISEITSFEEKISSKTYLTKRELLALMVIHWNEGILIKFHDLISPESYNKIDAACAFQYCLEFHAEKVVILKQAEPFDTIWIEKYPYYAL